MPDSNYNTLQTYLPLRLAETGTDTNQLPAVRLFALTQLKKHLEDVAASLPATAPAAAPEKN
jgi:hypothetical protein